ncbi:hypothetical protein EDC01DRAFT_760282 [Geopyxis carbonaria]|nr:hypothetical protein EDC01DRAFT_760282 [Geopyxis carbonaria]
MRLLTFLTILPLGLIFAGQAPSITRDVLIIGGGAAGTYAALHIPPDKASFALVESSSHLGGHAETYIDPATGTPIEVGVVFLHNNPTVISFTSRLGVSLKPAWAFSKGPQQATTIYANFTSGEILPPPSEFFARLALLWYSRLAAKYTSVLSGTAAVPPELLQPFGKFMDNNWISAATPIVYLLGQGLTPILDIPAFDVLKLIGAPFLKTVFSRSFLSPNITGGMTEMYGRAAEQIGADNLVLNGHITSAHRSPEGHIVHVETPSGPLTIKARKLLITAPPTLEVLKNLDLDDTERTIFSKWTYSHYYTAVISHPGLNSTTALRNVDMARPGLYTLFPTLAPGLHDLKFGSDQDLTLEEVKARVEEDMRRLNGTLGSGKVEWKIIRKHSPFGMRVPAEEVKAGWWKRARNLQGRRATWWTGAAWESNDCGLMWEKVGLMVDAMLSVPQDDGRKMDEL